MAKKSASRRSKFGKGTLDINVAQGLKAKELHALIDTVIRRHGCLACGLVGLDLNLRVQPAKDFNKLVPGAGVLGARFRS